MKEKEEEGREKRGKGDSHGPSILNGEIAPEKKEENLLQHAFQRERESRENQENGQLCTLSKEEGEQKFAMA